METKATAKTNGGVILIFPFHKVVNQLNTFTAEGIAINKVNKVKIEPKNGFTPATNIW